MRNLKTEKRTNVLAKIDEFQTRRNAKDSLKSASKSKAMKNKTYSKSQ